MRKRVLMLVTAVLMIAVGAAAAACGGKETTYRLTLSAGAGEGNSIETVLSAGAEYVLPENGFVCAGHEFVCWSDGTNSYNPGDIYVMPSSDTTLEAVWRAVSDMQLSYTETTYNGAEQIPEITVTYAGATLSPDDYTVSVAPNGCVHAGEYTVTVTGGADYADLNASATYTIVPKTLIVDVFDDEIDYGAAFTANEDWYTVSGLVAGDTVSVTPAVEYEAGDLPGRYEINADVDASADYAVTVDAGALTVKFLTVAVDIEDQEIWCDGTLNTDAYTVSGVVQGDTVTVELSTDFTPGSAFGAYTITGTLTEGADRYVADIEPGTLTVKPVYSVTFDDEYIRLTTNLSYAGIDMAVPTAQPQMTVNKLRADAPDPTVTLEVEAEGIATVEGQKVTASGSGETTLRAMIDGYVCGSLPLIVRDYTGYKTIGTTEEFDAVRNDLDGQYVLVRDLDFAGSVFTTIAIWASGGTQFTGTLDGNGFTVANIGTQAAGNSGIIGTLGAGGVVRDIAFTGLTVNGWRNNAVVALAYNGARIENVYVEGTISTTSGEAATASALLVGSLDGAVVENCIVNVTAVADRTMNGNSSGTATNGNFGVLVGRYISGTVTGCYGIAPTQTVGGLPLGGLPSGIYTGADDSVTVSVYGDITAFMEAVDTDMFAVWNWTFENAAPALVRHDGVWFTTESITILPGETRDISDLMFMTTDRIPEWRVSDETKLTVSDTRLTALAAGTCTLFASYGGTESSLTVAIPDIDISVSGSRILLTTDETPAIFTAQITGHEGGSVTWESSDPSVFTVSYEESNPLNVSVTRVAPYGGAAELILRYDDTIEYTVPIEFYVPVYTQADFVAIDASEASRGGHYLLMTDIVFENYASADIIGFWNTNLVTMINNKLGFYGLFDGNGYTISGISFTNAWNSGLFGVILQEGVVRNLTVEGQNTQSAQGAGGIVASYNLGTISNVKVVATAFSGGQSASGNNSGAIVGKNDGTMQYCYAEVTQGSGNLYFGALVGQFAADPTYANVYFSDCFAVSAWTTAVFNPAADSSNVHLAEDYGVFANVESLYADETFTASFTEWNKEIWQQDETGLSLIKGNVYKAEI